MIEEFLGETSLTIAFIPFAGVSNSHEAYHTMVSKALQSLSHNVALVSYQNAKDVLAKADAIMVGGGNTFKLLHDIYQTKILDLLRDRVNEGAPYIGWSAGSNILSPGIFTTNDMPIIDPKSLNALGLLPFQINPHYMNEKPAGHNGETRDQRLTEFMKLNTGVPVIGLPEGSALHFENDVLTLIGSSPAILFESTENGDEIIKRDIRINEDLSFLL